MDKKTYYSPDVICLEIKTRSMLAASDPNTITPLDVFDLSEE